MWDRFLFSENSVGQRKVYCGINSLRIKNHEGRLLKLWRISISPLLNEGYICHIKCESETVLLVDNLTSSNHTHHTWDPFLFSEQLKVFMWYLILRIESHEGRLLKLWHISISPLLNEGYIYHIRCETVSLMDNLCEATHITRGTPSCCLRTRLNNIKCSCCTELRVRWSPC